MKGFPHARLSILVSTALLSGLCAYLAFAPASQPALAWVFPMPMVVACYFLRPLRLWEAAGCGALAGLGFYGPSLFWLTEVSVAGWFAVVLFCTVFLVLWLPVLACVTGRLPAALNAHSSLLAAFFAACAFTGLEWVRGWIGTGFPWNALGVSQIEYPVIAQIAELGGIGLISWLVIFGGTVIALTGLRIIQESHARATGPRPLRPHFELMAVLALIGAAVYFGSGRLTVRSPILGTLQVLAVQPDIPQDPWGEGMEGAAALRRCMELTENALEGSPPVDLLVWPETPIPGSLDDLPEFQSFQQRAVPKWASAFLYGTVLRRGFEIANSAVLVQQDEPYYQSYDKMHLVMMGEYVPLAGIFPFLRHWVPLGTDFTAGKEARNLDLALTWRLAPLICFEDSLPGVARRFLGGNPHAFINITNDGWFGRSWQSWQHLQQARFRCIEFRRPMIRVANNGVTGWIDERGVLRGVLRDPQTGRVQVSGTMRMQVPLPAIRQTFYARWGDWPGWLSLWIVAAAGIRAWIRSPLERRRRDAGQRPARG
ncbi:MAG: apolipoprotein N-acyltransferase [Candidatus Methylacidiphilales bacterium]|nr:apolipoprotein N-acyltransferase [Candidatus Methylacidiphilales bacterium]